MISENLSRIRSAKPFQPTKPPNLVRTFGRIRFRLKTTCFRSGCGGRRRNRSIRGVAAATDGTCAIYKAKPPKLQPVDSSDRGATFEYLLRFAAIISVKGA